MVKVLFQSAHVGNDSQGFEKEISINLMKVVQADLLTVMKRQFEVLYRKCTIKYFGTSRGFGDSKANGTLQFEDENGKSLRCFGTAYIDRKTLAD